MRKLTILFIFLLSLPMASMAEEQAAIDAPATPAAAPEIIQPAAAAVIAPAAAAKAIAPATPPPAYLRGYQPYQGAGEQVKK